MRSVKLYGHLGKKFGREFRLNVDSPAEAFRALRANFPNFESYMNQHATSGFRVYVGKENVDAQGLFGKSELPSIRVIPVVAGAGSSPFGRIIMGVVIIAAALSSGGAALAAMGATGALTAASITSIAVGIGVSMVLGGVTQLLVGTPKSPPSPEKDPSYMFNGAVNTTAQGNAVPICYGTLIVGSQVISSGLSTEQNYAIATNGKTTAPYVPTPWDGTLKTIIKQAASQAQ